MAFLRKHRFEIGLVILLLIASYLRFVGIIAGLFAFTYDVGRDMIEVGKIVYEGNIPFIGPTTGLPGLFYGPWWYYLLVPSFIAGGGDPRVVAGFMALIGLGCVAISYYLGWWLGDKTFGFLLASLVAISPVFVSLSSQIWNPNIAPLILLLLLLVLHRFLTSLKREKKDHRFSRETIVYSLALGFLAGFTIDVEVVYGLLVCLSLGIFLLLILRKRELLMLLSIFVGSLIAFLPRILFEVKNHFIMTRTVLSSNGGGNSPLTGLSVSQVVKSFTALKTLWDETLAANNPYLGWILLIIVVFVLARWVHHLSIEVKQLVGFSLLALGVFFTGLSFFRDAIWGHYIVGLPVFYLFLFSLSVWLLMQQKRFRLLISAGFFILLVILLRPQDIWARYTEPQWVGDASVYRNQTAVLDYIYTEAAGKQFNYLVYTPAVLDYPYRYLFSWYGEKKYGYVPATKTEPLLFVVIEPDPGFVSRQQTWLKQREGDGHVVKEKHFDSGIIVQTRRR